MQQYRDALARNKALRVDDPVFITGYADASWFQREMTGGWSVWCRSDSLRLLGRGPCPCYVKNCDEAELWAAACALHLCISRLASADSNLLVLKTDSQVVCGWFGYPKRHTRRPSTLTAELTAAALKMANDAGVKVIVRWVKGHSAAQHVRAYLNNCVDAGAKQANRDRRASLWMVPIAGGEPQIEHKEPGWFLWEMDGDSSPS